MTLASGKTIDRKARRPASPPTRYLALIRQAKGVTQAKAARGAAIAESTVSPSAGPEVPADVETDFDADHSARLSFVISQQRCGLMLSVALSKIKRRLPTFQTSACVSATIKQQKDYLGMPIFSCAV
jgi:hypothetical protein